MRGKLDGRYATFVQASEKETLFTQLQEAEDWLYTEEGEDATKSAYVAKLDGLKKLGDAVFLRWKENDERPKAAAALREVINTWMSAVQSGDEKYSHIADADKEKVVSNFSACFLMHCEELMHVSLLRSRTAPPTKNGSRINRSVNRKGPKMLTPSSRQRRSTSEGMKSSIHRLVP